MVATAKRGWIGVDVGTRAIKLAQVEQASGRLRLVDAVVVPRARSPAGQAVEEGSPLGCREELRAALSLGRRFLGRTAACTISMHSCQVKPLKISARGAAEERSIIANELRSMGCLDKCEFDFWVTDTAQDASGSQTQGVIALTVRRSGAAQIAGDLSHCGLDCRVLDGLPLALARAVRMIPASDDQGPLAAVDWGFSEATFCAISGQKPTFVRRLRGCGFGQVLQRAGSELGLHVDEVEALLTEPSVAEVHQVRGRLHAAIPDLAPQALRAIVEELQRTLAFLKNQASAELPERIWLFGAGAIWRGAGEYLASKIGRPVETWRLQAAGIESTEECPFPEVVMAPAITLSALAWSSP